MEILEARDIRVNLIFELLLTNLCVISLRANYPGIKKDNETVTFITKEIDTLINKQFEIKERYHLNHGEGNSYVYLLNFNPYKLKTELIEIENTHPLGRLVDLDVYYQELKPISRSEFKLSPRTCFLCDLPAFYCIRNKTHSLSEVIEHINEVVKKYEQSLSRNN